MKADDIVDWYGCCLLDDWRLRERNGIRSLSSLLSNPRDHKFRIEFNNTTRSNLMRSTAPITVYGQRCFGVSQRYGQHCGERVHLAGGINLPTAVDNSGAAVIRTSPRSRNLSPSTPRRIHL